MVAAFEVQGYCPRDENVYVVFGEPGRMVGRVSLRDDRTLFLFVFASDFDPAAAIIDLPAQKAVLRKTYGGGKWDVGASLPNWIAQRTSISTASAKSRSIVGREAALPSSGMPHSVCP